MNLNSIQVYCNDNQTRTFISLAIAGKKSTAVQNLQHIANQLDGCLNEFKLPQFYKVSTTKTIDLIVPKLRKLYAANS